MRMLLSLVLLLSIVAILLEGAVEAARDLGPPEAPRIAVAGDRR